MRVENYKDGKRIILSSALDNRPKILNFLLFILFSLAAFFFTKMVLQDHLTDGRLLFIIIVCGIYLLAGYRFLNKALETEQILISGHQFIILKKGARIKESEYDIRKIENFRHLDKSQPAKHPLAGESFDYLGFQTEQQMINELYGDKRIAFDYDSKVISFGENIYSWDFEKLEQLLYEITGNDLRYTDDFEQKHYPNN